MLFSTTSTNTRLEAECYFTQVNEAQCWLNAEAEWWVD